MRAWRAVVTCVALAAGAVAHAGDVGPALPVVVRLREQAVTTLEALPDRVPRAERRRQVLERLRQVHGAPVTLPALDDGERTGRVRDVVRFWIVNAATARATPDAIRALAADPAVDAVDLQSDAVILPLPEVDDVDDTPDAVNGVVRVRAPQVWELLHATGEGAVVGVVDTGVVASHPDLSGRWRGGANSWKDLVKGKTGRYDDNGHGTHVTGTAVGHAGVNANRIGVAPGAQYIACKAFTATGTSDTAKILGCLQFMADPDGNPATDDLPDVVNGSWGGNLECDQTFRLAVQALWHLDVVSVFAGGNGGVPTAPAAYPESIAVGAVDRDNVVAWFSGQGPPTCRGPGAVYPDLVAPGVLVRSAWPGGKRKTLMGTSMAAPHVSGTVALLRGVKPQLSAAAIVNVLRATGADLGAVGPDDIYGYGLVDAFRAVSCLSLGTVNGCRALCP